MKEMNNNKSVEFNLDDLDELIVKAENLKSNKPDEESKMSNFTRIVKGISWKYKSKWVDREDLEQELWVRVFELAQKCGGVLNTDESLVASVCYKRAIDIYRYNRRRYESNVRFIENCGDNSSKDNSNPSEDDSETKIVYSQVDSALDVLLYKEVINKFKVGSKERKYVVVKLVNSGLLSYQYLEDCDKEEFRIPEKDTDAYICMNILGYNSGHAGGWTSRKRYIHKVIYNYLGISEE